MATPLSHEAKEERERTAPDLSGLGRGALWSGLSSVVLRAGTFMSGIITARIIVPEELGVFAVALTVHLVLISFSELGIGAAMTRHTGGDVRRVAASLATVSAMSSAVLATGMVVFAPVLAGALGATEATTAVRVLALTLVVNAFCTVPAALLSREFRQDKRFVAELAGFLLATGALLVLLLAGWGPMALAWSRVVGMVGLAVVLNVMAGPHHGYGFDRDEVAGVIRFGAPLAAAGLTGVLLGSLDYIVIGRSLGNEALGLYVLAYTISSWPISIFTSIVMGVGVPAFSRVRGDGALLAQHMTAGLRALLTLALPVSALTMGLAKPLVDALYGTRWTGAVPALVVLAAFGALRVPIDLLANVLIALGRTRLLLELQLGWLAVLLPAMVIGVDVFDTAGAAWAHVAVAAAVTLPAYCSAIRRLTGVRARSLVRSAARPFAAAVLAAAASRLVAQTLADPWIGLAAGATAGLTCYLACLGPGLSSQRAEWRALWGRPRVASGWVKEAVTLEAS